jgi:hypothetical protein
MRKTPLAVPLTVAAPPSMQHYLGQYFGKGDRSSREEPADEYARTLLAEAGRISYHGHLAVYSGNVGAASDAAGMMRDAARLLDLYEQRQRARDAADEARRQARKAAARAKAKA